MTKGEHAADAERLRARALARWESEGGATANRGERGEGPDELDLQILTRLGSAILDEWSSLPTSVQRALFLRATTSDAPGTGVRLRSQIANFLHSHKNRAH